MKKLIPIIAITLSALFFFKMDASAEEEYVPELPPELEEKLNESLDESLYLDGDGTLWFVTDDAKRGTKTFYRTAGFVITRCKAGTKDPIPEDFFSVSVDEPYREDYYLDSTGNERVTAYFRFDEQFILECVREESEEWYQDIIKKEKDIYLKFDGIMMVCRESTVGGATKITESGMLENVSDSTSKVKVIDGQVQYKGDLYFSAYDLMHNSGVNWSSGTSGAESHFNKYFMYSDVGSGSDSISISGGTSMDFSVDMNYVTGNTSLYNEYILGKGVPTSESIVNEISCDEWVGTYSYTQYNVKRVCTVTIYFTFEKCYLYRDGGWVPIKYTFTKKYEVTLDGYFALLSNLKLLDLESAVVFNDAYPDGYIKYTNNKEIPWEAVVYDKNGNEISLNNNSTYNLNNNLTEEIAKQHVSLDMTETYKSVSGPSFYGATLGHLFDAMQKYMENFDVSGFLPTLEVRSDYLSIDGVTVMNNEWKEKISEPDIKHINTNVPKPQFEETQTVVIPSTVKNGVYPTKMRVYFDYMYPTGNAGGDYVYTECAESDPEHIKYTEDLVSAPIQSPIIVHTPVISPVEIVSDDTDDCQLNTPNLLNLYDLILGNEYTLLFSNGMHLDLQGYGSSGGAGDASKYEKYVSLKQARFPFEVRIGNDYYPANTWVTVENQTVFWIPTWAKEYDTCAIEVRVIAENFDGIDYDVTENSANLNIDNYIATYSISCSVSGQVYDFQVVGITDAGTFYWSYDRMYDRTQSIDGKNPFTKEYEDYLNTWGSWNYSFYTYNEQKRAGGNNRFGNPYIRLADGSVIKTWSPIDCLPIAQGSSHYWPGNMIPTGEYFSYTLKTIGDYNDDAAVNSATNDYVLIKPVYRFVELDGTVHETSDIDVYYNTGDEYFIKYGSERDLDQWKKTRLYTERLKNVYSDNDFLEKLDWYTQYGTYMTEYFLKTNEWDNYCLSNIVLPLHMSGYYTGCEEELYMNQHINSDKVNNLVLTSSQEKQFTRSMQTWYGEYYVPEDIFICDAGTKLEEVENLSTVSDIWYKEGYLVLSFEIYTYQNGIKHLNYINAINAANYGMCNMWEREQGSIAPATRTMWQYFGDTKVETEIEVRDGDVMIMDISEKWMDNNLSPEYLFIN